MGGGRERAGGGRAAIGRASEPLPGHGANWHHRDWGDDGESMHWCCTEGPEAYIGGRMVVDSLADELTEVLGKPVYVELRRRLP